MSARLKQAQHSAVLDIRHEAVLLHQPRSTVRLSEIIGPLSYAIDLAEGHPAGHTLRSCWIGMHIGERVGLDSEKLSDLYFTLLLKDIGGTGISSRIHTLFTNDDIKVKSRYRLVDTYNLGQALRFLWQNVAPRDSFFKRLGKIAQLALQGRQIQRGLIKFRAQRSIALVARMGLSLGVADGIRCLDEHYNGHGEPEQKKGDQIPIASRIALLAQVFDLYHSSTSLKEALNHIRLLSRTWFDPVFVSALEGLAEERTFTDPLRNCDILHLVRDLEPAEYIVQIDEKQLNNVAEAFGEVIDAKSTYTHGHAVRVANYAQLIAREMGLPEDDARLLYRAGMLHDIGVLGISNSILDKPFKLGADEWRRVKFHPVFSEQLLKRVDGVSELAFLAGAHHERLDGNGYPRGLKADEIPPHARILSLASAFDAIYHPRAYHPTRTCDETLAILEEQRGLAYDGECLDALRRALKKEASTIELFETV